MKKNIDQVLLDRLAQAACTGAISRRSFLHFASAAGLTASAATGLWGTSAAANPTPGGTFRWGIHDGNTSDTHDPGTYVTRQMIFLAHTHRSYLTLIEPATPLVAIWPPDGRRRQTPCSGPSRSTQMLPFIAASR